MGTSLLRFNRTKVGLKLANLRLQRANPVSFNRTKVGLKRAVRRQIVVVARLGFNRTKVGLKHRTREPGRSSTAPF